MFLEIAEIPIKPGLEGEFEARVKKAAPLFQRAKGCNGLSLQRSLEAPSRYRLFVHCRRWTTTPVFAPPPATKPGANSSCPASPARRRSST
jgi:heme-degrading monooxygenase HmoA